MSFNRFKCFLNKFTARRASRHRRGRAVPEALERRVLLAVSSVVVKDLNTAIQFETAAQHESFVSTSTATFFVRSTPGFGEELWTTDGTESGTRIVRDIGYRGLSFSPFEFAAVDDELYFQSTGDSKLWRSDATLAGTTPVSLPEAQFQFASVKHLTSFDHELYFIRSYNTGYVDTLFKLPDDGSGIPVEIPLPVSHVFPFQIVSVTAAGSFLLIQTSERTSNRLQLHVLSASGAFATLPVADVFLADAIPLGDRLLFSTRPASSYSSWTGPIELWVTDGSAAETSKLPEIASVDPRSVMQGLVDHPAGVIWFAQVGSTGRAEIWQTDATVAGTRRVVATDYSADSVRNAAMTNGVFWLEVVDQSVGSAIRSDGTVAGTVRIQANGHPMRLTPEVTDRSIQTIGDHVLITTVDSRDARPGLWVADTVSDSAQFLSDVGLNGPGAAVEEFHRAGDRVIFTAGTNSSRGRLWVTDGTSSGTANIGFGTTESSNLGLLSRSGDEIRFTAYSDDYYHVVPWRSDGTASGTSSLIDTHRFEPESYVTRPWQFDQHGRGFNTTAIHDRVHIWTTVDSNSPARRVKSIPARDSHYWNRDQSVSASAGEGFVFLLINPVGRAELWFTDSTDTGTQRLAVLDSDVMPLGFIEMQTFRNGIAMIGAQYSDGHQEFWTTDGTVSGTRRVHSFLNHSLASQGFRFSPFGDQMMFVIDDRIHGLESWVTDGSSGGTQLLIDISSGVDGSDIGVIHAGESLIYFTAVSNGRRSWWVSDGTRSGTHWVAVATVAQFSLDADGSKVAGDNLFFVRRDGYGRPDLLASDNGAVAIPILPQTDRKFGLAPDQLFSAFGLLFLEISDDLSGRQLWTSDGTIDGTHPIAIEDEYIPIGRGKPFRNGIEPYTIEFDGALVYAGDTLNLGTELVRLSPDRIHGKPSLPKIVNRASRSALVWSELFGAHSWEIEVTQLGTHGTPFVFQRDFTGFEIPPQFNGQLCSFRIRARHENGSVSDWSEDLRALVSDRTVIRSLLSVPREMPSVLWENPNGFPTSEIWINDLERNERVVHLTEVTSTSYRPVGLQPSRYAIWIRGSSTTRTTPWSAAATFSVLNPSPAITLESAGLQERKRQVSWGSIPGVSGFEVTLTRQDGATRTSRVVVLGPNETGWTTPPLSGGSYEIAMRLLAPGRVASDPSNRVGFLIREAPRVTVNSSNVTWAAVGSTSGYEVRVLSMVTGAVIDSGVQTSMSRRLPQNLPPGPYRVDVRATYHDVTVSDWSMLRFEQFASPVNAIVRNAVTVDATPIVSWAAVPNATQYELVIQSADGSKEAYRRRIVGSLLYRVETPLSSGKYSVWIRAHFALRGRSSWGTPTSVGIGPAPLLRQSGNQLTWFAIADTTRYEIHISLLANDGRATSVAFRDESVFGTSLPLPSLAVGRYRAWLRAIRDESGESYRSLWSLPIETRILH